MNPKIDLPPDLQLFIGNEPIDFAVFSKRNQPMKNYMFLMVFGTLWTLVSSFIFLMFFGSLFRKGEVHFESNGIPTTGSWENLEPMTVPFLGIGSFIVIGLCMISWSVYSIMQNGGYFVGTPNRLIRYHKQTIKSYNWELFTDAVELNNKRGDITMELYSGKMVSSDDSPTRFVADTVYISGVADIMGFEKLCRKRIKENSTSSVNIAQSNRI